MPGIARKIILFAAIDGLIIQPLSSRGQKPFQPVRIKYGDAAISTASRDDVPDTSNHESSFEAFGVIGLITVSRLTYLVTITQRQQVASLFGSPIYVVTGVALTPCSSQAEAKESIGKTARHLARLSAETLDGDDSDISDDELDVPRGPIDEIEDAVVSDTEARPDSARSSVAEDVIRRRGSYGRFTYRWFGGTAWTAEQKRFGSSPTLSPSQSKIPSSPTIAEDPKAEEVVVPAEPEPTPVSNLLPKLLRAAQIFFGSSRSFYFSYDVDITRSLGEKTTSPGNDVPLHARVDSVFFWNRHVLQPFMDAGKEALSLPLMQGFVGQQNFTVDRNPPQSDGSSHDSVEMNSFTPAQTDNPSPPESQEEAPTPRRPSEKDYTLTVVSRRSTKRAGLRYLRRGIDQDGFVANMVETEQFLSPAEWNPSSKVYSFLQVRGSIPLFFTQSPYSLKPVPVMQHSDETNMKACQHHFERLRRTYGAIQIVNLVEKRGTEGQIGTRYEKTIEHLNTLSKEEGSQTGHLDYEWFDFHQACRGMKFEKVSLLLSQLRDQLESFGSTSSEGDNVIQNQKGVVRTNCMDCLDRTNVCQSSFARHMLEVQLKEEGFDMSAQVDQKTAWFNILWADNGDAVSKQYASTAAMKGDYTRTKKRDYRGALNDLGLSLARFYSGMVNDYFSQTAIDFLLGNVTETVFDEFEADMMTKDPAVSVSKMREQAIDLCQRRVVADETEEFHGGWVLLSPGSSDTVKGDSLREVVLVLTDAALYLCRFDWNLDKVSSFERVHLASLTGIKLGTYITSTVSPSQMDVSRNVGFVVHYQPGKSNFMRTNTRTFSSSQDLTSPKTEDTENASSRPLSLVNMFSGSSKQPPTKKLAFKAPYADSSTAAAALNTRQTEMQQVAEICAEIERLALDRKLYSENEEKLSLVERGDIISLEEAKRNTTLLEHLGHSIKRLVWA